MVSILSQLADGLNFASTQYDNIYLNNNDVQFMHTYYPITTVKAVIGSKKEQFMELLHSQQIVPSLNVGFKINKKILKFKNDELGSIYINNCNLTHSLV